MSDGTTATISPVTEDDTMRLSTMFHGVADALVNASSLAKELPALRSEIERLQAEVSTLRTVITSRDAEIEEVRQARNAAQEECKGLRADNEHNAGVITELDNEVNVLKADIAHTRQQLAEARKAHDDAELRGMELEDKLAEAHSKLRTIEAMFARPIAPPEVPPQYEEPPQEAQAEQPRSSSGQFAPAPQPYYPDQWNEPGHGDSPDTHGGQVRSGDGW